MFGLRGFLVVMYVKHLEGADSSGYIIIWILVLKLFCEHTFCTVSMVNGAGSISDLVLFPHFFFPSGTGKAVRKAIGIYARGAIEILIVL